VVPAVAVACLVAVPFVPGLENPFPAGTYVADAWNAAEAVLDEEAVVLVFDHDSWPQAAGIFQHASRQGHTVCVRDWWWQVLFLPENVCTAEEAAAGVELVVRPGGAQVEAGEREVFAADGFVTLSTVGR
jgi:hypothetical protein